MQKKAKSKIAVIGMAGLFPGSETTEQFWDNLMENRDLVSQSNDKDFGASPAIFYHEEKGKLDKCYALRGGYVRDFTFQAEGYKLPASLLEQQDDQFKWSLYVARQALEDSGYWTKKDLGNCGVILGNLSFPTRFSRHIFAPLYTDLAQTAIQELTGETLALPASNMDYPAHLQKTLLSNAPAALIAQAVGLKGTHYALDAACASSLYAVKLACDELHTGRADMMLAGAVSAADPLFIHMGFSYFHAYAREGEKSAPLDDRSGGLTSSEGAGMIVLKRLADAQRDGDRIIAVIDAVGLSNDGKGKFLLSPNPKGQRLAFERAYEQCGLLPADIDYIECHATGTPLGDKTEFDSISDFFAPNGAESPLVGSAKSNMGHLLTAAGMAGILKVIMAMQRQYIPATINISSPLQSSNGKIAAAQIVRANQAWPKRGDRPRAGINAFGFGGTNAHLILSAHQPEAVQAENPPEAPAQAMAITGMDLHFGACENLDDFYLALFKGQQYFKALPEDRWKGMEDLAAVAEYGLPKAAELKGAWLTDFDLNLLRFKIQPKEAERLTLQQTLMLKVADRAIKDAGLDVLEGKGANIAVITAMESELEIHHRMGRWDLSWQVNKALEQAHFDLKEAKEGQLSHLLKNAVFQAFEDHSPSEHTGFIGNIISSRISSLMDFTGPAFTISSNENAVYKALEVARNLLAMKEVDAVVLGAIDLSGSIESVISRQVIHPMNSGRASMGWNEGTNGWLPGEGAGAIVLKRVEDSKNDRVYARIEDIAVLQSEKTHLRGTIDAQTVQKAAKQVLQKQAWDSKDIGLLEVSASGFPAEDRAEIKGLTQAYRVGDGPLTCALACNKANIGHTFSASGMAAIIRTALSLYYRFIPAMPGWEQTKYSSDFEGTPFYVPTNSRPWVPEPGQKELRAAISGLATDGTAAHVLLAEGMHPKVDQAGPYWLKAGERLLPLGANSESDLLEQVNQLATALDSASLAALSNRYSEAYANGAKTKYTAVFVASSIQHLQRDIQYFQKGIPKAFVEGGTIQTPGGSYFTTQPLGEKSALALVYPGSGSAYIGLGAALFQAFPGLYDYLKGRVDDLSTAFFSPDLYPRSLNALDRKARLDREARLQTNALPMMAIGCTFSAVYTQIVQDYLGLKADSVIGYSMGETSAMWYGQGIWDAHYAASKFLEAPLFSEKVGGKMGILANLWSMSAEEAKAKWTSRLIKQAKEMPGYTNLADWFRAVIAPKEDRVYLTFINTDTEIIISGDRDQVQRIIDQYQLSAVDLNINNAVHHHFCRQVEPELIEMHHLPIEYPPTIRFYSSISRSPLLIESEALAKNGMEVCCQEVDWPALVRQMAADGHGLFLELGANATCSRWIDEVLADQQAVSIPIDRKGASVLRNLNSMIAMLLAHGVALDLSHCYAARSDQQQKRRKLNKTLRTGGHRFKRFLKEQAKGLSFQLEKVAVKKAVAAPALAYAEAESAVWTTAPTAKDSFISPSEPPIPQTGNSDMIKTTTQLKKAENGLSLQNYDDPSRLAEKNVIWDEEDLLNFAKGKISDVFGAEYGIIDTYPRRVMLPMPPYLLVSRVTKLSAKVNEYKPATITTEYDIPYNSFFATDGQIPWAVAVESGQCDLLLISYLGIDFQNKGEYVYRLLDCTLTFLDDLPFEGQTLRYDISINSYVRNGNNLLFFFSYECFVEDRMVLKMDGGCAGFFSDDELSKGQGVVYKQQELDERNAREKIYFPPLLNCNKTSFSREELLALTRGDLVTCFNESYHNQGRNPSLRLPPEGILMMDRINKVDLRGGSAGLGLIEAEKDLHPDDWYFPCHFRDDEVLAGSLQAEGGGQLLRFYMLLLGMQRVTKDARFQPVLGLPQKVRCRKEVPAKEGKLTYRMDVKEVGLLPAPYVIADLEILYDGYIAVYFENLGLRLQEKEQPHYLKSTEHLQEGIFVKPVDYPVLLNEYHISQFALGPVYKCFGEEYKVYEGRELSRQPNTDLQFISRVLEVQGERHTFNNKPIILSEYDVPANAWYYTQNANPVMPYSVLMEVALQPCGFLGAYLGSTLGAPDEDLFFRNLDGDGEMIRNVDLRGKTVKNKACLVSHTRLGGTVLQRYSFELSVDGEVFYKGQSSFGFFTKADLSSQAGLDQGKEVLPWLQSGDLPAVGRLDIKLDSLFGKMKLYRSAYPNSPKLHLSGDQLNLLDTATIIRDGGKYGKGYIYASKEVKAHEWFFTCHFYQDPVMPGSLGVEAIIQAIQLFALQQGLGDGLHNVAFQHLAQSHKTVWKYRGQILRHDPEMNLEAHIKEIRRENNRVTILADASLWKGRLRIYELTDLALVIAE
ncbi:MAG: beta-ketoacyl synthase N-terminal-like domain-containing protein [Bacteroidota bacterium]